VRTLSAAAARLGSRGTVTLSAAAPAQDAERAHHDIDAYLNLLAHDGTLTLVGAPERPLAVSAFSLLMGRRNLAGASGCCGPT
jgi:D-arabinose 1-dehydrogenase-like Zn-dependent alcohol dehydrogenase